MNRLNLTVPPVIVFAVIGGLMLWSAEFLPMISLPELLRRTLAGLVTVISVAMGIAAVVEFRRFKTSVDPHHPTKASAVVNTGVYSRTRNPMYLGLALLLLALTIAKASPFLSIGVAAFVAYINRFQIVPEEAVMEAKFGDEYVRYKNDVGRWI